MDRLKEAIRSLGALSWRRQPDQNPSGETESQPCLIETKQPQVTLNDSTNSADAPKTQQTPKGGTCEDPSAAELDVFAYHHTWPEYATVEHLGTFLPSRRRSYGIEKTRVRPWRTPRATVLITACAIGLLTFCANLSATLIFNSKFTARSLRGSDPYLWQGNCAYASSLGSGLHVIINLLSTLLLSASNLCMQILAAPTRSQIDSAHRSRRWLDIGIPSFHNFRAMSLSNRVAWTILAVSSLPLHFLYNSAVYNTKPINHSHIMVVTPEFLNGDIGNTNKAIATLASRGNLTMNAVNQVTGKMEQMQLNTTTGVDVPDWTIPYHHQFETICIYEPGCRDQYGWYVWGMVPLNWTATECLQAYSDGFGKRSSSLMVATYDVAQQRPINGSDNSVLFAKNLGLWENMRLWRPHWLCGFSNSFDCRKSHEWKSPELTADWNVFGYKIDYCLGQTLSLEERCSVRYSLIIFAVVCAANACKLLGILYTSYKYLNAQQRSMPLVTLGDAVESFLCEPDDTTESRCLYDRSSVVRSGSFYQQPRAKSFEPREVPWHSQVTKRRWTWTLIPYFAVIFAGVGLFIHNARNVEFRTQDRTHILGLGWGEIDETSLGLLSLDVARYSRRTLRIIITVFANMWHWAVSILYMQCNALLTCFCIEAEWQNYGTRRKGLRVTAPRGLQRSTYFVSLPARYGLTLMAGFAMLHWSLSQSLSLLVVESVWGDGKLMSDMPFLASKSWPILTSVIICLVLIACLVGLSFKTMTCRLPQGATCSAVISAACHRPAGDTEAHLFPVQWGEVAEASVYKAGEQHTDQNTEGAKDESPYQYHWEVQAMATVQPGHDQTYPTSQGCTAPKKYAIARKPLPKREPLDRPQQPGHPEPSIPNSGETLTTPQDSILEQGVEALQSAPNSEKGNREKAQLVGHCCFTTAASVKRPQSGKLYM